MITTAVTIGLQESEYTATESDTYEFVCAEVQSGDVAGRDIEIDYLVEDSSTQHTLDELYFTLTLSMILFQLMPRLRMGLCCSLMMPPYNVWQCQSHLSVLAPLMNHVSLSLSLLLPLSLVSHSAPLSRLSAKFYLKVGYMYTKLTHSYYYHCRY